MFTILMEPAICKDRHPPAPCFDQNRGHLARVISKKTFCRSVYHISVLVFNPAEQAVLKISLDCNSSVMFRSVKGRLGHHGHDSAPGNTETMTRSCPTITKRPSGARNVSRKAVFPIFNCACRCRPGRPDQECRRLFLYFLNGLPIIPSYTSKTSSPAL